MDGEELMLSQGMAMLDGSWVKGMEIRVAGMAALKEVWRGDACKDWKPRSRREPFLSLCLSLLGCCCHHASSTAPPKQFLLLAHHCIYVMQAAAWCKQQCGASNTGEETNKEEQWEWTIASRRLVEHQRACGGKWAQLLKSRTWVCSKYEVGC